MKIKYLEIDEDVNVYVVGDIHGSYTLLKEKLKEVGFNFNTDLLIAVGDLVDRSQENEKCVGLLNEHWFTFSPRSICPTSVPPIPHLPSVCIIP